MDRAAIKDLFAYTDWSWRQITQVIAACGGDDLLRRPATGSGWPALRDCLGHMILAYHRWLAEPVRDMPDFDANANSTRTKIEEHRVRVRSAFRARLDGVTDAELAEVRGVDIDGDLLPYSRGELLAHLLLHERGHHGDVTTLFYQLGVQAPTRLEYRFHLLEHRGYD